MRFGVGHGPQRRHGCEPVSLTHEFPGLRPRCSPVPDRDPIPAPARPTSGQICLGGLLGHLRRLPGPARHGSGPRSCTRRDPMLSGRGRFRSYKSIDDHLASIQVRRPGSPPDRRPMTVRRCPPGTEPHSAPESTRPTHGSGAPGGAVGSNASENPPNGRLMAVWRSRDQKRSLSGVGSASGSARAGGEGPRTTSRRPPSPTRRRPGCRGRPGSWRSHSRPTGRCRRSSGTGPRRSACCRSPCGCGSSPRRRPGSRS